MKQGVGSLLAVILSFTSAYDLLCFAMHHEAMNCFTTFNKYWNCLCTIANWNISRLLGQAVSLSIFRWHITCNNILLDPVGLHQRITLKSSRILTCPTPMSFSIDNKSIRSRLRNLDHARQSCIFHPCGRIDGFAKQLEAGLLSSQYSRCCRAWMQSHSKF